MLSVMSILNFIPFISFTKSGEEIAENWTTTPGKTDNGPTPACEMYGDLGGAAKAVIPKRN